MRRILILASLSLLLLVSPALRAEPEDLAEKMRLVEELMDLLEETETGPALPEFGIEDEDPVLLRIYNVADLTFRLTNFIAPNLELKPAGAEIDESQPLFGRAEEGEMFFSGSEELMDLITYNVRPETWEGAGAGIFVSGESNIIVRAKADVLEDVEDYLMTLRATVGKVVTVEARLLRVGADQPDLLPAGRSAVALSAAEGRALLARARAGSGVQIAESVRLTGFNGQQLALHAGGQRSFVQDYDVEVAQESSISDPIVGILQTGFALQVLPIARGDEQIILDLRTQIAWQVGAIRTAVTPSGPVQVPCQELTLLSSTVTIADGGFALLGAGGSHDRAPWYLLVRGTSERMSALGKGGAK